MKKLIYISLFLFAITSCEKQIITPSGMVDNHDLEDVSVDTHTYRNVNEVLNAVQKDLDNDLIIDPNSRDDVGDKKNKKSK